jgi:hypothetical protein
LKQDCPGYRDQLLLLFRDESQAVIRKAMKASHAPRKPRTRRPTAREGAIESRPPLLELSLEPGQDEALCFFLHQFAWEASSLHFNTWRAGSSVGAKVLESSMSSVGLAMMSFLRESPSLRLCARKAYASALRLTNAALSDRTEATTDTTLAAIILLSLFEVILLCSVGVLPLTIADHYGSPPDQQRSVV